MLFLSGCAVLKVTGQTIGVAGKIVTTTIKATGEVVKTTGKVVTTTGEVIKTIVKIPGSIRVVKLVKEGNSLFVNTLLNRKVKAKLLLDTGCTDTQISKEIAKKLRIPIDKGNTVLCKLANGQMVTGRAVTIKEVRVGRVRAYNVRAVVLDQVAAGKATGLLGMSFLDNFIFKVDSVEGELILEKRR